MELMPADIRDIKFKPLDPDQEYRLGELRYKLSAGSEKSVERAVDNSDLLRFKVKQGVQAPFDAERDRPYLRSEINSTLKLTANTVWLTFEITMLDMRYAEPVEQQGQAMICQIKSEPDHGAPIFRIDCCSDALTVRVSGDAEIEGDDVWTRSDLIYEGPPMKELKWERFVARVEMGPDGDGEIELWRNGKRILGKDGLTIGYIDKESVYAKFGLYTRESVKEMSCLITEMDFADNRTDLVGRPF